MLVLGVDQVVLNLMWTTVLMVQNMVVAEVIPYSQEEVELHHILTAAAVGVDLDLSLIHISEPTRPY